MKNLRIKLSAIKTFWNFKSDHLALSSRFILILSVLTGDRISSKNLNRWFGWSLHLCYCNECKTNKGVAK